MGTIPRHATVDVVVDAPPTAVWEVVGDPRRTGEWSHECLEVEFVDGATAPAVGVRFRGRNQVGRNGWSRTCEIVGSNPVERSAGAPSRRARSTTTARSGRSRWSPRATPAPGSPSATRW